VKICLIEPFHTGSHAAWAEEYANCSRHDVQLLKMSGRRWKWRMHGGAVTLARQFLEQKCQPDLLLVSDMLDLTTFLALTRPATAVLPVALYFHENQLTYPWPVNGTDTAQQHAHYAFINYTSAMAADAVFFNSQYHLDSFLGALPVFLKSFPDQHELASVDKIRRKSEVLSLGLDLRRFDQYKPKHKPVNRVPLILWNHRWEYDKNPDEFFQALYNLMEDGVDFEVAVLGESFRNAPGVFAEARQRLGNRIIQFGYAENFADYADWLWRADLVPVHSHHDFFGASVIQAIYCGCTPLLPKRLAYPEHLPKTVSDLFLYEDFSDLKTRLRDRIMNPRQEITDVQEHVSRYDWQVQAERYDERFEKMLGKKG